MPRLQLGKNGELKPFEAVVRVKVTRGVPGNTEIVALRRGKPLELYLAASLLRTDIKNCLPMPLLHERDTLAHIGSGYGFSCGSSSAARLNS